jgi:hypothetical protein
MTVNITIKRDIQNYDTQFNDIQISDSQHNKKDIQNADT